MEMTKQNNLLTSGQLIFMIIQTQIGVGLLGLTNQVHEDAKGDSWISVIVAGLLVQVFISIMWMLSKRFENQTIYDYLPKVLGRYIGTIIHFCYVVYFMLVASFIVIQFSKTVQNWVLIDTPRWIVMGMMCCVCFYLVKENLRTIARFFVLVFFCNIAVIVIAAYAYIHVNFLYLLPVGQEGIWNITKGVHRAMTSFAGYEMLLICYPFVGGTNKQKFKAASIANLFTTILYTFAVLTSIIVFSPPELALLPQPLLYMVKALSFTVIERPDLYFLSLWAVVAATSFMGYTYMASRGLANLFQAHSSHQRAVPYAVGITFTLAVIFQNPRYLYLYQWILSASDYIFVIGVPIILLLISVMLHKSQVKERIG
ncbi:GerAB/ArcD/ProY family transporter [Paenibacillus aquistagni]|uniref:Spore germination protein (Amino acid permease) n=1 Tax=Paenibacillus aquistagni TaxID=1852522 RepID=A0A1X7J1X2_9BACL|nr:GerAB/ArcD/ProY family transporter [Paenibacillus aquistagni]SMG21445.1 spore germination protein (amino acid permease) [Paenibacillus aquistagni]